MWPDADNSNVKMKTLDTNGTPNAARNRDLNATCNRLMLEWLRLTILELVARAYWRQLNPGVFDGTPATYAAVMQRACVWARVHRLLGGSEL